MPRAVSTIRVGLVGYGKIARDQHLPAIAAHPDFVLSAVADPVAVAPVPTHRDVDAMLATSAIDAVVLCQPPAFRFDAARNAIRAGKHVLLEKPPGATIAEVALLLAEAQTHGVSLYAAWHSRMAPGSRELKRLLAGQRIDAIDIVWREDVRVWHPGQRWLWEQRGFGVFDPGINALSILTDVLGETPRVTDAELEIPSNQEAPIAARLIMESAHGALIHADFDFRETGTERWEMTIRSGAHRYALRKGGAVLEVDGIERTLPSLSEYTGLYTEFAALVRAGKRAVDYSPLAIVADAWLVGKRLSVARFDP
ncbi:MAG: galactose 1-dehydrogenase [Alphaproteobacteria bacterium HGW-Alphaproteobacteria-16]|nr:MAG: galactose 1-dehydrogenase [Alphaproteobacteria bacterium HGW-Alphaproteobacteria-16]